MADLFENPMGLDGFEFVEFTAPQEGVLEPVFEVMGFTRVAVHRSKQVALWRQGDINFIINAEPNSFAQRFAREHGPCVCAMAFRVRDANAAFKRAIALGAIPVLLGLLGAHYPLTLGSSEDFLPELARHTLAPFAYVLFIGAIVSVILSSVDSSMLAIGALAAHNLFANRNSQTDDARRLRNARTFVVVSGELTSGS